MKKVIAIIVFLLFLLAGCDNNSPDSIECVLCTAFPRHAPCLVDLNSGEILELNIYQPHHTKVAELSDEQYGGYMSLVQFGEISGILLGADRVELIAPTKTTGICESLFCESCRILLNDNKCQGYILADLRNPEDPSVWQIAEGISATVRCYEIDITASGDSRDLLIVMKGTLGVNQ